MRYTHPRILIVHNHGHRLLCCLAAIRFDTGEQEAASMLMRAHRKHLWGCGERQRVLNALQDLQRARAE